MNFIEIDRFLAAIPFRGLHGFVFWHWWLPVQEARGPETDTFNRAIPGLSSWQWKMYPLKGQTSN